MARQRERDTLPEMRLRAELWKLGCRYRKQVRPIAGLRRTADLAFPRQQIAVFVDGCYWHGCVEHKTVPKANAGFWLRKVEMNRARDRDTDRRLTDAHWSVIRVWEHDDPKQKAIEIAAQVLAARAAKTHRARR